MGEQTAKAPGLNRAKTYQLVLFPLNNGATNVYYVLVLSYIATFGSKVLALSMIFASVMVTGMRLFDAITDPIIGALMDRTNGKFGKETSADILSVGGGMTGSYHIDDMQCIQIGISPVK